MTFSSTPKKGITKPSVSSCSKNQQKLQWQKFMQKAPFLPRYEKLHGEEHWSVLHRDSDSSRYKSSPKSQFYTIF